MIEQCVGYGLPEPLFEEAADYWDTHSFAEYIEDTEPVEIEVNLKERKIYLEIDNDLSEKLRKIRKFGSENPQGFSIDESRLPVMIQK